jgi:hypothetical protein
MTSENISDQVGTEKLSAIYEEIVADKSTTRAERLMLAMMMLDLGDPKWLSVWEGLIKECSGSRFVLDVLMERLWHLLHTRPISDAERKRVEAAAGRIEAAFGFPKQVHSNVVKNIRDTAKETARREKSD